jgi:hypothetical protein
MAMAAVIALLVVRGTVGIVFTAQKLLAGVTRDQQVFYI